MNARKTCYIILAIALVMSLPMWAAAQEVEKTTFLGDYFNVYGSQLLKFNTSDLIGLPGDDDGGWVGEPDQHMFFQGTTIWGGTITTPCVTSNLIGNGCIRATWPEELYSVVVLPCPESSDEAPSAPAVVTVYKPWDCGVAAGGKLVLYSGCPLTPRCASFGLLYMLGPCRDDKTPVQTTFCLPPGNPVRLLLQDPFNPNGPTTIWALNSFTATVTLKNGNACKICLYGRAWFQQGANPPKNLYLKAEIEREGPWCWGFEIKLTQYPNNVIYCAESKIFNGGVFAEFD